MSSNNCPVFSFWGSFSSINHSSTFFFVFNLRNIQSLSLPWPRSFTRDSLRYKTPLAPTNSCWKWNPCVQYHIEHLSSKSNFRKQWKDRPAVCSLVVDCHWFLADSLSLLHEAAEGQGAPETLLLTGRKTNSLHFTSWTSSRSNVLLTLRCVCVCVCVFIQNIDTLERVAGLEGDDLIEAHGTFYTSHCVSFCCRAEYNLDWMKGLFRLPSKCWSLSFDYSHSGY